VGDQGLYPQHGVDHGGRSDSDLKGLGLGMVLEDKGDKIDLPSSS
jgi:hypothetical protein